MQNPAKIAFPRKAATVVLLRAAGSGLEALLLQRLASMAFAGGEWVFPGGALDAADSSEVMLRCTPESISIDAAELAIRIAACRETFEESGVLLARYRNGGGLVTQPDANSNASGDFAEILMQLNAVLDIDRLAIWSNWITPSFAPRRFDTWFFAAAMPPAQSVRFDAGESQAARWVAVDDLPQLTPAINSPPTLFTLREIATRFRACGSLARLLESARHTAPASIMLKMLSAPDGLFGLLPWDPDYASAPGEGTNCDASMVARFRDFPSRFALDPVTKAPRGL